LKFTNIEIKEGVCQVFCNIFSKGFPDGSIGLMVCFVIYLNLVGINCKFVIKQT